jgi:hypothetical protein
MIFEGDCREVMCTLDENSIDAIVTDPPYELGFMGKAWDKAGVAFDPDTWRAALRVLKPGGHLLAFGGSRTYHRLVCAIEDAGFEVRDQIMWVYGSGFPKSRDVSKAIDKVNGQTGRELSFTQWFRTTGVTKRQVTEAMVVRGHISQNGTMAGHYFAMSSAGQPAIPTAAIWADLRPLCSSVPAWIDDLIARIEAEREVIGQDTKARSTSGKSALPTLGGSTVYETWDITASATDAAKQWQGWGTALKPAHEPIVLARKPLAAGTVASNVVQFGTGALNIDACRVASADGYTENAVTQGINTARTSYEHRRERRTFAPAQAGRWPANLIHDGSDEVEAAFAAFGEKTSGKPGIKRRGNNGAAYGAESRAPGTQMGGFGDTGTASRFFYCAKASKRDRDDGLAELPQVRTGGMSATADGSMLTGSGNASVTARANHHPTVKPTELMRYLCRLVTPPGGTVFDPFAGTGSTGRGAILEGFNFIGAELSPEYAGIARRRIKAAMKHNLDAAADPDQLALWSEVANHD